MAGAAEVPPEAIPGYRVRLEHFYGPLDLLLHLVQQHEVDIMDVPIAVIADQYLEYLRALERLDIEVSAEFLSMASYLMVVKARALAPVAAAEEEQEEDEEPGSLSDLIRRLLEFRRVKDRSLDLAQRFREMSQRAARPAMEVEVERGLEVPREVEVWDLVVAFARLAERTTLRAPMTILFTDLPVEHFMEMVMRALQQAARVAFGSVVGDRRDRGRVIGTFLAVLELAKQQRVRLEQASPEGEIVIVRPSEEQGGL
jgi:segregation and condensation protein A